MMGSFGFGKSPSTTCKSVRQTPQAPTLTRISPAPGSGVASSINSSGAPFLCSTIARIEFPVAQRSGSRGKFRSAPRPRLFYIGPDAESGGGKPPQQQTEPLVQFEDIAASSSPLCQSTEPAPQL